MNEKKNPLKEVINRKEPNGNDRTENKSNHSRTLTTLAQQ